MQEDVLNVHKNPTKHGIFTNLPLFLPQNPMKIIDTVEYSGPHKVKKHITFIYFREKNDRKTKQKPTTSNGKYR